MYILRDVNVFMLKLSSPKCSECVIILSNTHYDTPPSCVLLGSIGASFTAYTVVFINNPALHYIMKVKAVAKRRRMH